MLNDICKPTQKEIVCERVVSYINAFQAMGKKQPLLYFKNQLSKRAAVLIKPKILNI